MGRAILRIAFLRDPSFVPTEVLFQDVMQSGRICLAKVATFSQCITEQSHLLSLNGCIRSVFVEGCILPVFTLESLIFPFEWSHPLWSHVCSELRLSRVTLLLARSLAACMCTVCVPCAGNTFFFYVCKPKHFFLRCQYFRLRWIRTACAELVWQTGPVLQEHWQSLSCTHSPSHDRPSFQSCRPFLCASM